MNGGPRQTGLARQRATKRHQKAQLPSPVFTCFSVSLRISVRLRRLERGLDADRAYYEHERVPDQREVQYGTRAGDRLLLIPIQPDNVNVRASVVREKRGV